MKDFFTVLPGRPDRPWRQDEPHWRWHWHYLPEPGLCVYIASTYRMLGLRGLHANLTLVAARWLHVTVLHSAADPELPPDAAEAMRGHLAAGLASQPPILAQIGPAQIWGRYGIGCRVAPSSGRNGTQRLWAAAAEAHRTAGGGPFLPAPGNYSAHLTLAYATGDVPDALVRQWIGDVGHLFPTLPVLIDELALVKQTYNADRDITWDPHGTVQLTGAAEPANAAFPVT